jgi:hypothetical protein
MEPFQRKFTSFLDDLASKYYDSLLKAIIVVFPFTDASVDIPKSPYGFDFFLRRIPNLTREGVEFFVKLDFLF